MTLERSFSASAVQIQQVITGLIASAGKPLQADQAGYLANVAELTR